MKISKSFFEYLGLADVERIHSQFLAWVLSENCNALDQKERDLLLFNLFGVSGPLVSLQTERNRIDILLETATDVIVIENKIKSSQHSNQLATYKEYIVKTYPKHTPHYFFLTLANEKTIEGGWHGLNYSFLLKVLSNLKIISGVNHSVILNEYLLFLNRLDDVVKDFHKNIDRYEMVFLDGHKKKHEKKETDYRTGNEWFIAANQLETILQKSFLISVVEKLKKPVGQISETRGDALVNFPIEITIEYLGKTYSTGLQLQGRNLKFTFAIKSDKYTESKSSWIENLFPIFEQLRMDNRLGYIKLNKPKKLAYISISKVLEKQYWKMTIEDLASLIQHEYRNCQHLTKDLQIRIGELPKN